MAPRSILDPWVVRRRHGCGRRAEGAGRPPRATPARPDGRVFPRLSAAREGSAPMARQPVRKRTATPPRDRWLPLRPPGCAPPSHW